MDGSMESMTSPLPGKEMWWDSGMQSCHAVVWHFGHVSCVQIPEMLFPCRASTDALAPVSRRYTHYKPIYAVETYITRTGTPDAYVPKGSWVNPQKKNWKKVEVRGW